MGGVKRYERMSSKEVVDLIERSIGDCSICPVTGECTWVAEEPRYCADRICGFLNEEIKQVQRISTLDSVDAFIESMKEFEANCHGNCNKCKYQAQLSKDMPYIECRYNWLAEMVEVYDR